jgi:1-phosphatidylinositol-3-phosphate 5-kinase
VQVPLNLNPQPTASSEVPSKPTPSRLPRLADNQLSVAELIQKYQIPDVSSDIETLSVAGAESEADSEIIPPKIRKTPRSKSHKRKIGEVNEAYPTIRSPRQISRTYQKSAGSRIPGLTTIAAPSESRGSSRQASPERRNLAVNVNIGKPNVLPKPGTPTPTRTKGKLTIRTASRDKSTNPIRSTPGLRRPSAKRNPSLSQAGKVNTLTRQFEKLSRENDRLNKRYSVIRGRRARPVASAKARVEVFENVREAILDESGNSEVDEADDEEDNAGDSTIRTKERERRNSEGRSEESSKITTPTSISGDTASATTSVSTAETTVTSAPCTSPVPESLPETPDTTAPQTNPSASVSEHDTTPNNPSIVDALNKLWSKHSISPHLLAEVEAEDPLADPEHIFRESDIVVRTDEPTSIIALTLECVYQGHVIFLF